MYLIALTVVKLLGITKNAFASFPSEYRSFQHLEQSGFFIKPGNISIAGHMKPQRAKNKIINRVYNVTFQFSPMKRVLTKFVESPNVFNTISTHINEISKEKQLIKSVLQCQLWGNIFKKYDNKIVFPLTLYFDDYEINEVLGSNRGKNKLGAVYYKLSCLPYEHASKLQNIFLAQIHKLKDHDELGRRKIFSHLITEINDLKLNGIDIIINNQVKKIYVVVVAIQGDNFGLNTIFGFVKSFSAMHYCRICSIDKYSVHKQTNEDVKQIRTKEYYEVDVSQYSNGITEDCVFNNLKNFHVIQNIIVDPMHDLYEGIRRYGMGKILYHLIKQEKLFSLTVSNKRITFLNADLSTGVRVPPEISPCAIEKQMLILSASEMSFLIQHFGIWVGD